MQSLQGSLRGLFGGHRSRASKEAITAYLFLLPASLIIFVFGLWPVVHALYVSLHKWNIKPKGSQCFAYWFASLGSGSSEATAKTDCLGVKNYAEVLGLQDVGAVGGLIAAIVLAVVAYALWKKGARRKVNGFHIVAGLLGLAALILLGLSFPGLLASGEWTYLVSLGLVLAAWLLWKSMGRVEGTAGLILRLLVVSASLGAAAFFFFVDFKRMWELGNDDFFRSLIYTVFYSAGTVPMQLALSLVLAYVLFQGIRGQGWFRLIYFLPYIAPSVATAVVFKRIFSLRETGLANEFLSVVGIPPLKWLHEAKGINPLMLDLINQGLGTNLQWPTIADPLGAFLSGPSLALVSIIIYNIWVFVGYDTVIYLAGLGNIPHELYEAAKIDGAGTWSLLRRVTIPLLSPTTFFLMVIGTIGTFKAFNHIWIMYERASRGTVDVASVLIFRVFRSNGQFGEAAAMSFILFGVILALSKVQNKIGEKMVFYG
jgi:ABC-type sugar transport system permease subunit